MDTGLTSCGAQIVRLEYLMLSESERHAIRSVYMPAVMELTSHYQASTLQHLLEEMAERLFTRLSVEQTQEQRDSTIHEVITSFSNSVANLRRLPVRPPLVACLYGF
ncbi:uncharacterized protein BKA78DRAFT_294349 [Phyllosticta capitalensis]|uniref:uncharacterized protein n=1 Tax=Phyllosticta capitalensis TaxID=121624 RepID=UPI00313105BB